MATGRIHHIGIVVDDLAEAVRFLSETLRLEVEHSVDVPERALKVAFLPLGDVELELIELADPVARQERLGDAPARIEHIAIEVADIDATFAQVRSKGVETASSAPEQRGANRTFFTKAETSDGVKYQFLQVG